MKLTKIEEILKKNTDKTKFNTGFVMKKRNLVYNEYFKIDDNNATFYATVMDEYHRQKYTSMITINTKNNTLSNVSCDCANALSKKNKVQVCEHIVATVLKSLDLAYGNTSLKKDDKFNIINPVLRFNISQDLNCSFSIKGINNSEHKNIFNSFKENKKFHRLPNGNYLDLKDTQLEKALNLVDVLGMFEDFDNIKISNNKAYYIENYIEENECDFAKGTNYLKNISKKIKLNSDKKTKVPKELNATLRNYQIQGLEFFNSLANYEFGGILADDMGLGKTIQTIAFILSQKNKKSIIITPTTLVYNWKNEIEKFAPDLKFAVVHGYHEERKKLINNINDYDVILTTYGTFKNDLNQYDNIKFDYCFIDEAQNIKNPDSIITKTIKSVNANIKFALTGTPIENNLTELWSIFDFVMPGYLYEKSKFQSIFVGNDKNSNELKKMIKPFMLRRKKEEVLDELPDKIEQKFTVDLENEHKRVYNAYVKLIRQKLYENNQDNISIFSYLTKLRQLCLAPEIMVKNYGGTNSKLNVLMDIIKDSGDKKILVFSQFTKVLDVIKTRLENKNINYSYIDGKVDAKKRVDLVEQFNKNDDKKVFLISLKAGGTGLNLTSASIVVHFDPWWNPAIENQATDRAHRIGQKNVVNVIKLIAKDTVEERVVNLQESKKALIEEFIDNNLENSKILKNLSKDELIDLFMN